MFLKYNFIYRWVDDWYSGELYFDVTRDRGLKHVPEKVNNSDCKHPNFCHVLLVINR